jgi:hypothetical protein
VDLRFAAPDESQWLEFRDLRPGDELVEGRPSAPDERVYRGLLRAGATSVEVRTPLWVDATELADFRADLTSLLAGKRRHAVLSPRALGGFVTIRRRRGADPEALEMRAELAPPSPADMDQACELAFPLPPIEAERLATALAELARMRGPASEE